MHNSTKDIGDINESRAVNYIEDLGFRVVERNYFARKLGEIDIIAIKDNIWHFIEVKSAKANFDPIYNLTPRKLRRIINSTNYYIKTKKLDITFSIDIILIRGDDIEILENITI